MLLKKLACWSLECLRKRPAAQIFRASLPGWALEVLLTVSQQSFCTMLAGESRLEWASCEKSVSCEVFKGDTTEVAALGPFMDSALVAWKTQRSCELRAGGFEIMCLLETRATVS